jgi:pimeloyl-ACP methyl ester carboxylesterase
MKWSGRILLGLILLAGLFFAGLHWASRPRATGFVLEPNETALDEFSRQKRYLDVGPWRVAYIDQGEGPPVVLLHGCPFHSYQWRDLMERLQGRRVLAPDLLGLGDTQVRLTDDYRLPNDVAMVVGFLDALGVAQADFVTADHGAATLQLLMRDHPERIRAATISLRSRRLGFRRSTSSRRADSAASLTCKAQKYCWRSARTGSRRRTPSI